MLDGLLKVKRFSSHARIYAIAQSHASNIGLNYLNVTTSMYHSQEKMQFVTHCT